MAGRLILVVGPSGAGKDTLIDGAKSALKANPWFVFPRREITRPAEAGGEDHNPVSLEHFETKRSRGGYALQWGAHELFYGVPRSIEKDLDADRSVIVNVSRSVIDSARAQFPKLCVLLVTAPEAVLRARLIQRGRESSADIDRRVARAAAYRVTGSDVVTIVNDGAIEDGVSQFIEAITE